MQIHCCQCDKKVEAVLVHGNNVYPNHTHLYNLPFWQCLTCNNFVGCHHKTKDRTRPLGCIPTKHLKFARQKIHQILDPLWRDKKWKRTALYKEISKRMNDGHHFHTSQIRTIEDARKAYKIIRDLSNA